MSFGGEREKGGQAKYLVAVGGDNNQTMGVFDLKAASVMLAEREDDHTISAPILAFFGMDKLPGALPTVFALQWVGNGGNFVSLSQGKSLKFWEMVEGGQNDAGTPNTINQKVSKYKKRKEWASERHTISRHLWQGTSSHPKLAAEKVHRPKECEGAHVHGVLWVRVQVARGGH